MRRRRTGAEPPTVAEPWFTQAVVFVVSVLGVLGCEGARPPDPFVGSRVCGDCHEEAIAAWQSSLHARAAASPESPLVHSAFDGASVGGTAGRFVVEQAGGRPRFREASSLRTFEPVLVLGNAEVEQWLVPGERGRLQAFPIAFDPEGGEWFDLFPEGPDPDAWTHWTQPGATANAQCLECHVTGYEKGYAAAADAYRTRWHEMGVGCEACHGPGRAHVRAPGDAADPYTEVLPALRNGEPCMPCHALRVAIAPGYRPGWPLADFYDLELLDTGTLHTDGQLRGEAYEWTQFRMSRMAMAGVGCTDCHEPHRGRPRQAGDALCLGCHDAALASPAHTHHDPAAEGSRCVGCHMPARVFMERDARRDHAFSRPDPTRAVALDAPDPCTGCHAERNRAWAAEHVERWYGHRSPGRDAEHGIAVLLEAGRRGGAAAAAALGEIATADLDPVRRASATRFLAEAIGVPAVRATLIRLAADDDPWVRAAAVRALGDAADHPAVRDALLTATRANTRLVRIEAAFALARLRPASLGEADRAALDASVREWLAAQEVLAELPETHFNKGLFWAARGDVDRAVAAYRQAIRRWPADLTPRQNLALTLLEAGQVDEATRQLREALAREPDWPPALFGLGLAYRAVGRLDDAAAAFEACVRRAPRYPRAAFELGEARLAQGDTEAAARAFETATQDSTARRDALRQLVRVAYLRDDKAMANRWLPLALLADPATADHPAVRQALGLVARGE